MWNEEQLKISKLHLKRWGDLGVSVGGSVKVLHFFKIVIYKEAPSEKVGLFLCKKLSETRIKQIMGLHRWQGAMMNE